MKGIGSTGGTALRKALLAASAVALCASMAVPANAQSNREIMRRLQALEAEQQQLKEELRKEKFRNAELMGKLEKKVGKGGGGTVKSGKKGGSLTLSGQVNRALLFSADGKSNQVNFVDNDSSSTRFRMKAKYGFDKDISAGSTLEVQIESNSSNTSAGFSQFARDDDANGFTLRIAEVWAKSKTFGKVSLGQGKTASDGTSEMDLSGTALVMGSDAEDRAGSLCFRRENGEQFGVTDTFANTCGGRFQITRMFDNLDGLDREDRIRYDTPKFYGFQVSTSAISQGGFDVAGRFTGVLFEDLKVAAAVAFARAGQRSSIDGTQVNGSISALHKPSGLNVTFAAGNLNQHREVPRVPGAGPSTDDANFWYVKGGWTGKIFDMGKTSVSVDFFKASNEDGGNGNVGTAIGFGGVQKVDKIATELYLGVTRYNLETDALVAGAGTPTNEFSAIWTVLAGARVKF